MGGREDRGRWTLVAVCATTFMLLVDITIVNVALPSVQRELDASLTGLPDPSPLFAVFDVFVDDKAGKLFTEFEN